MRISDWSSDVCSSDLSLYRNDVDFADVAVGANQAAVAGAIQSRGIDDPLFEAVVNQNAAGARAAYADLSGEIIARTISGLHRSEERRVGKGWGSTCRYRWAPEH